ncbi:MAG: glycosyltransferase family 2 protein [Candidatus Doudnabacteria bacterium]|nr:glycosyltransferase family 2 protein [Candidatus Doudnabacteria bacterium]
MINGNKIAVVMPAYNAEKTLVRCYQDIPQGLADIVILVDDCSRDNTVEVARKLPIIVHRHERNLGYGGNQKTCYRLAFEHGADVIIMLHPDHQYDPKFIPEMVKEITENKELVVFGSRMINREHALAGGMPRWKFVFNIILTKFGNILLGTELSEFHSGFRAYHRKVFEVTDIRRNSDNFVFDTQMIIQLKDKNIKIKEIPITTRYFPEASQIGLIPSIRYGCGILYHVFLYKTGLTKY